ncbi:transcriptional regulator [Pseudoxanthomonas kalamensis DSM 18571]|uniref:cupin-like domain-containing protein n=1 Tax=Pseudoxanthomonas kalamensis TaxID=289483 RepID=UPI001390C289|nr:cupin-like domain-containing protein [Pseudoxanthomonas kalamensis]KAF1710465.1 transcriptional regulator [Pseudoxanthomonas kalamensis DSM 18571]
MQGLKCFEAETSYESLDREAFVFRHTLLGHPALSLDNLSAVLPRLPSDQVFHSNGRLEKGDNFDRAHLEHRPELSLEATLEQLRTTDAYIMVRKPEADASFQPLMRDLLDDVRSIARAAGIDGEIEDPMLYMFIASPNSVTPFHIDRYSTFLLQFRGSKEVTVFPPWDARVVSDEDAEHFFACSGRRPAWRPETAELGQTFGFNPGQVLHIPFAAGHHVRNGSDDVSISLSIIFNTERTRELMRALMFNHHSRPWMRKLGMSPRRAAMDAPGVTMKSGLWNSAKRLSGLLR